MDNFKALAIIPARGNSKGLPRKNIRLLGGIPLVAHAILTAQEAGCFDRIIVSTEDPEIAEVAVAYGAEIPFLRPQELAGDKESTTSAVNHLLLKLGEDNYYPDFYATLYPTHPFRNPRLVAELVSKGKEGMSPVFTARETVAGYSDYVSRDFNGQLTPIVPQNQIKTPSGRWYRSYGYFFGQKPKVHNSPYFHILQHPIEWVDIDTQHDMELAERIICRGLNNFEKAA
ncbi:cytidylyltransferase domain-containing protein [Pseudodesulfovibrio sediminis]|uniref:Pseudaminic acid cytidylyltransferase n=1 Tax=Pseudodesulfovibrio sediminis TaxID=2810563 RepID=A0ABM7P765_9BACT|nr:acylneuraminate cytidylyltransferase family protein [Pseudodesulfovibrio sediminis]BCS89206.1 pseudaminic acid cytidylyltransferase [Pseudodesulfovibrio sediminis]